MKDPIHTVIPEAVALEEYINKALVRISEITCPSCNLNELHAFRDVLVINAAAATNIAVAVQFEIMKRDGTLPPVPPGKMN